MSSVLWCVTNGRASAPPAIGCIIGVSTSRYPRAFRNVANRGQDLAAHLEDSSRIGVDDQIEIALAVADLDVAQAVPFFRQRDEALDQKFQPRGADRQLVRLGPEQLPSDADEIPEIEQLENGEVPLGQRVLPDVDLDARRPSEITRKFALPKLRIARIRPAVVVSTGRRLERLRGRVAVCSHELIDGVGPLERPGIGVDTKAHELLEIGASLAELVGFAVFFGHVDVIADCTRDGSGGIPPGTSDRCTALFAFQLFSHRIEHPLTNGTASSPLNMFAPARSPR